MRKLPLFIAIISVGIIFITRLYYLQVHNSKSKSIFDDSAIQRTYEYPKRGYIYNRKGELLVANQSSYDIMVIPREVKLKDSIKRNEFCDLLNISLEYYNKKLNKARKYSPRLPSSFVTQVSKAEFAILQEKLRKFNGFYFQKRSLRLYKTKNGANVLGDIGEVNPKNLKKDAYYKMGDLIGKKGVELSYEKILRGQKGVKFYLKDRFNKTIGSYKNGIYDTLPIPGKDITITIDSELQAYGELLMQHKRGGIIALNPENGEILAMVSAPSYDPSLLVGRNRSANFSKLYLDKDAKPTFDRGLQAQYPPGSPFKIINALIGLQEGAINTEDKFICQKGYYYGTKKLTGCHQHQNPVKMENGIAESCNAYFVNVYRQIIDKYKTAAKGTDVWAAHAKSFGLGRFLNNDLAVGMPGRIPDGKYYNDAYSNTKWGSTYTVSNAIGQGEVETTPIQLANMVAAVANRGFYYTPHIIKAIENDTIPKRFTTPNYTTINEKHFEPVIEGMHQVYVRGTAKNLKVNGINICGKTGTAENFIKIEGTRTQLTDHSIFVAFAPKDNPKIAIAVFVENGYYGNRFAGRMASLMIEKHIRGYITRTDLENWIFTHSLEKEYAKPISGEPFYINNQAELQIIKNYAIKD